MFRLQKHKFSKALLALLLPVVVVLLGLSAGVVSALTAPGGSSQPPGTCFVFNQGNAEQIGPCKTLAPGVKDSSGAALSASKCYQVEGSTAGAVASEVNCDGSPLASTAAGSSTSPTISFGTYKGKYKCGGGVDSQGKQNPIILTTINIGCEGKGNPILDMIFGVIRFLSVGAGLVVIGSIVVGGIQYSSSRGDPNATAQAVNRIRSALTALLIFIFSAAILDFIIPGAILK